ncbi:bifunctional protein-serine/threonine kinase/phosphatase [Leeia sp. TBRC 13508]|uniref:Bifunctional protein-serine/threonine kinase/phosphatase n=1 Tax=Leeia speluncae TaxID=2884804 RepID=A0ABS8D1X4_9NEIS|nr:bifunctional protein-serine/threonine kinase/phosphatase [Leeia speluncae]MCB6182204.1 bifunctional protein-serine/threonine kinase/phosphatase [Leeia speluncae]
MLPVIQWFAESRAGLKDRNEDAWMVVEPEAPLPKDKGVLVLLADGVSDCADGAEAATSTVRQMAADYYALPDTLDVVPALERLINAQNQRLRMSPIKPLMTTLCGVILRGQRLTVVNLGDTRCYRIRNGAITQLSVDHSWDQPGLQHVLKRALGLDSQVIPDFVESELLVGDRYVLVCDGVWEPLGDARMQEILSHFPDAKGAAQSLVRNALQMGSTDNVSAIVVDVEGLPARSLGDELVGLGGLPVPARLNAGEKIDGLTVKSLWRESRNCLLYRVEDETGQPWLMKTLPPISAGDVQAERALLTEEWILRRLGSHYFPELCVRTERRHLYLLMKEYQGSSLAESPENQQGWSIPDVIQQGIRMGKALGILHRRNILHRDVKPENLHWGVDKRLRLLDFGAACCPGVTEDRPDNMPGTPSFMAPELLAGELATAQSDLYAAGVTLYWLLTHHYPYGEIEPFQKPVFGEPVSPARYRPDTPAWLESVLLKAVATTPERRFETAEEFVIALERGESLSLMPKRLPLMQRQPLRVWQSIALGSLLLNLLLLYTLFLQ